MSRTFHFEKRREQRDRCRANTFQSQRHIDLPFSDEPVNQSSR